MWVSDVMAGIAMCKKIGGGQGVRARHGNKRDVVESSGTCVGGSPGICSECHHYHQILSQDCLRKMIYNQM